MERTVRVASLRAPLVSAGAAIVAGFGLAVADPTRRAVAPACPLLSLTGWSCPLCGGTRAAFHLVRADVPAAFGSNALIPLMAVAVAYGWLAWTLDRAGRRSLPRPSPLLARRLAAVTVLVLVVFGVARNLPAFTALAP